MSRRKMDGPHFPLQQTLDGRREPSRRLERVVYPSPRQAFSANSSFAASRVRSVRLVGRVTPNSGDLRGGGDYGSQHAATCRTTVHSDRLLRMSIDAMHCTRVRW